MFVQIPPGGIGPLIDVGRLLPVRMEDDSNEDEYILSNTTAATGIVQDWAQILADVFASELAWEEIGAQERNRRNSEELMATLEEMAFFVLQVLAVVVAP